MPIDLPADLNVGALSVHVLGLRIPGLEPSSMTLDTLLKPCYPCHLPAIPTAPSLPSPLTLALPTPWLRMVYEFEGGVLQCGH